MEYYKAGYKSTAHSHYLTRAGADPQQERPRAAVTHQSGRKLGQQPHEHTT